MDAFALHSTNTAMLSNTYFGVLEVGLYEVLAIIKILVTGDVSQVCPPPAHNCCM